VRIDDDARLYIWWDATLTFDPATATVELDVDGTRYPMTWQGAAVSAGGKWTRTARTSAMFVGTARTVSGSDVKLTAGRHVAEPIVTAADGQVVPVSYPTPVDVS